MKYCVEWMFKWRWYILTTFSAIITLWMMFSVADAAITSDTFQEPGTLVDTSTLQIISTGRRTAIYDRVSHVEYHFTRKLVHRSKAATEAHRAIETNTLTVDILPGGGLIVHDLTAGRRYTLDPIHFRNYYERGG